MKKSTRALTGLTLIDGLLLAGAAWLVLRIKAGAALTVPPAEAIEEITTIFGGAIGLVTTVLALAWWHHRRNGN